MNTYGADTDEDVTDHGQENVEQKAGERRHQAHLARLMAGTLTMMMYQSEREHGASEEQTALIIALGNARTAAEKYAGSRDVTV